MRHCHAVTAALQYVQWQGQADWPAKAKALGTHRTASAVMTRWKELSGAHMMRSPPPPLAQNLGSSHVGVEPHGASKAVRAAETLMGAALSTEATLSSAGLQLAGRKARWWR